MGSVPARFLALSSFLAIATASAPVRAEVGQWTTSEGVAELSGNITREQARRMALERARANAVEKVTGVSISDQTFMGAVGSGALKFFSETRSLVTGRVIAEEPAQWTTETIDGPPGEPPIPALRVRIKVKVAREAPADPSFTVALKLNKTFFGSGEALKLTIRTSRDAHLMVFNLAADDRVYVMYPNAGYPDVPAIKNTEMVLPDQGAAFELRCLLLPGHIQDVEAIKVIATAAKVNPPESDKKGSLALADFYRWLMTIPAAQRAEASIAYSVFGELPKVAR